MDDAITRVAKKGNKELKSNRKGNTNNISNFGTGGGSSLQKMNEPKQKP